jgi:hypothetical protein
MHAGKASRLCTSWQKSFAAYFFGLDAIDVWPLELHWPKHSVSSILSLLQTFSCRRRAAATSAEWTGSLWCRARQR